jgi:integrase
MSEFIDEYLALLVQEGKSPETIADRGRCLRRLHDDLPYGILGACTEHLRAWLAYERWSPATRYTYTGHILPFYAWLMDHPDHPLDDNPAARIRRPRVPAKPVRIATDDQLAIALTAPEPLLTAVILANYDGLRRAECAGCYREDITEEIVTIRRAKGGDAQVVPTHPAVWAHVRDRPPGPLVPGPDGQPADPEWLGRLAGRWFTRHGLRAFGLHHFRRRFGTLIQREHHDPRITMECLRDRTMSAALRYMQVSEQQTRRAIFGLGWTHRPADDRPVPPAPEA